jgi:hypothetical protein
MNIRYTYPEIDGSSFVPKRIYVHLRNDDDDILMTEVVDYLFSINDALIVYMNYPTKGIFYNRLITSGLTSLSHYEVEHRNVTMKSRYDEFIDEIDLSYTR